jgi:prolyl-tRNA synthetase
VRSAAEEIRRQLPDGLTVELDDRENLTPGWKFNEWELKGVPLRIEVGPRDVAARQAILVRRDTREKLPVPLAGISTRAQQILEAMQADLLAKARRFREEHTCRVESLQELAEVMNTKEGFVWGQWCRSPKCEAQIQEVTQATIRCLPLDPAAAGEPGKCLVCGADSPGSALIAKAY